MKFRVPIKEAEIFMSDLVFNLLSLGDFKVERSVIYVISLLSKPQSRLTTCLNVYDPVLIVLVLMKENWSHVRSRVKTDSMFDDYYQWSMKKKFALSRAFKLFDSED